ncbi:hypothetical protein [Yersinia aldovae]|uniref:Uncharacterized protein n=1 Tax=Yersinia aldovae TaxID=29483 RepID=A0ABM9STY0_YERAL|nr:hypothetical protein [Yersinia aldovae]CNL09892.1 Uncharacterised protein [Yersinia aldovae]
MSKIYQSAVIFLLSLITLKLYPEFGDYAGFAAWILFAIVAIGGIIVGAIWVLGVIGDRIANRDQISKEKKELKEISRTLKDIDRMNKGR